MAVSANVPLIAVLISNVLIVDGVPGRTESRW